MKVAAEIELAGLKARHAALDSLIKKGEDRAQLLDRVNSTERQVSKTSDSLRSLESSISRFDEAIKSFGPFELYEDKVVIQPIKWVTPQDRR